MSNQNVTSKAHDPAPTNRFTIAPGLGALLAAAVDMEEVAERLHAAGFEPIPLGGVVVKTVTQPGEREAQNFVDACVLAIGGRLLGRRTLPDGQVELRVGLPAFGGERDRSKQPAIKRWPELPFDMAHWRNGEDVPIPPGWKDWGKDKAGKPIVERRGSGRRNVGLRTGPKAGLVVIDIDLKEDRDGYAGLRDRLGERLETLFPDTFRVETPSGGAHWYYATDEAIHNSTSQLAPGVDVRGEGGYVVGPGSVGMTGTRYCVTSCQAVAPLPAEAAKLLLSLRPARPAGRRRRRRGQPVEVTKEEALDQCLEQFPDVPGGQRHDVLVRVAGVARNLCDDDALEWVLRAYAERQGVADRDPEDLDRIIEDAKGWERTPPQAGRRTIVVDFDEAGVVYELEEAMADAPDLFQRGQQLVNVLQPKPGSKKRYSSIAPVSSSVVRTWTTDFVDWVQLKKKAGADGEEDEIVEVPVRPPGWAISAFHTGKRWPNVAWLEAVVEFPVLLPNGSVLAKPGYDEASGLFLATSEPPSLLPDRPTLADAEAGLDLVAEIFHDFPFADEPSRSAAIAALLTPLARHAIDGPVPMFAVDKAARGTGGSLTADCIGVLLTGRTMPRMVQAGADEEQRKAITSLMIEGAPLVLLDNVAGPLGTPALDALLTGTVWKDRLLGVNEMVTLPNWCTLYATGNNLVFRGDTSRRTLRIRLESELENPEDRDDFKHPELLEWIKKERRRLLGAALTVLKAYCGAGRPRAKLPPWGSFEAWSALVRQALVWAGMPDPAGARATADDELDADKTSLIELILGLEEMAPAGEKLTAREINERLRDSAHMLSGTDPYPRLRAQLTAANGKVLPAKLITASHLRRVKGRVWDGRTITSEKDRTKTSLWYVKRVGPSRCDPPAPAEQADAAAVSEAGQDAPTRPPAAQEARDGQEEQPKQEEGVVRGVDYDRWIN